LRFLLEDLATGNVLVEYITGEIPPEQAASWKLYGFGYISTVASVRLSIYNAASGSGDNDLALDDVEIRHCTPPVTVTLPANDFVKICEGTSFTMDGLYVDDTTFGMDLTMRLERNLTGRFYDPTAWTPVNGTELTSDNGSIDTVYSFVVSPSDTGYYRVVASSPALIDRYYCRAMSRIVRLDVTKVHIPPDIRIYVKPEPGLVVNLSSYIDSLHRAYDIQWTNGVSPALLGGTETTTGTIDFATWGGYFSTHIYTYEMTDAVCGTGRAKVYLRIVKSYSDTLTVRICKDLPQTDRLNLNQILGLEAEGGQWTWLTNTNNVFSDNVTVVPAGRRHEGAYLFDAVAAFAQAGPDYYYKNNPNEKKFEFEYSNHTGTMKKKVKLIVY
jgi:hypothetical protein